MVKCFYYTENAAVWQANHRGFQKKFVPTPAGAASPQVGEGKRRLPNGAKTVKALADKTAQPGGPDDQLVGEAVALPAQSPAGSVGD